MPRSKRGPALFDLLSDQQTEDPDVLKVPGWWERRAQAPAAPPARCKPQTSQASRDAESRGLNPEAADPAADGCDRNVPFIELDGERVRLSFTSLMAALVAFAALVVVFGMYELGRTSGEREGFKLGLAEGRASYMAETMSEIEAARREPPATHLVESLLKDADTTAAPEQGVAVDRTQDVAAPRWVRDHTYIVAQEFSSGREQDALRAQEFLAQHGLDTELVRYPTGSMQLITTQGYNLSDATQRQMAKELQSKVHAVGAKYYASGGGYKLEGYLKTLKDDHW